MASRRPRSAARQPREIGAGVQILHADRDLVVVLKPAGILSSRVGKQTGPSVFDAVKQWSRDEGRGSGRRERAAWIIHRLDREVSGLLVFALSKRSFGELKRQLAARRIVRRYAALVEGELAPGTSGELRGHLRDLGPRRPVSVVDEPAPGSVDGSPGAPRFAATRWRSVATGRGLSLLEVRLDTGRKHQIRAQLADFGHAIFGDVLYGARPRTPARLALHASDLAFVHPGTRRPCAWNAPLPPYFAHELGGSGHAWPAADLIAEVAAAGASNRRPARAAAQEREGWEHVADWYAELVGDAGSDHHDEVIVPGTLRLLAARRNARVLDVACGEGLLARRLAGDGVQVTGVDASAALLGRARARSKGLRPPPEFLLGDARALSALAQLTPSSFDAAACVLALMNLDPIEPVLEGIARLLRPQGRVVLVLIHPAFRGPGRSAWGWEAPDKSWQASAPAPARGGAAARQFRRVDSYLSASRHAVVMNPGAVASGAARSETCTWHRPLGSYVAALSRVGLFVDALEEWPSARRSSGPAAAEENRARAEFPLFLALRARLG